ncbi:MAG: PQQ-dependent sugar dehydrogenase [Pseudomonadota bacterium]
MPFSTAMRSALIAAALSTSLLSVATRAQDEIIRGEIPPMPEPTYHPQPEGIEVQEFATDLEVIWSIVFSPDERIFVTERPGRVQVLSLDGERRESPWLDITERTFFMGESGLTGLALHPEFPEQPWVYVMYTYTTDDGPLNRLSRFRDVDGQAGDEEVLLDGLPAQQRGGSHSGGTLEFGGDGMLYVATGDAFERQRSADLDDPAGAVLRLTPEGEVPADNPWPDNPIWAHGLRNVHGLDWQPGTGRLFAADNGPTGEDGLFGHDRVIILEGGAHHGWPVMVGAAGMDEYVDPILTFNPSMPPADVQFYDGDLMPGLQGDLFVSVLGFMSGDNRQTLQRIRFQDEDDPSRPTAIERWFHDGDGNSVHGRLRALAVGPDGALYVGTSNHDGRQTVEKHRQQKDRILRIVPAE